MKKKCKFLKNNLVISTKEYIFVSSVVATEDFLYNLENDCANYIAVSKKRKN